MIKVLLINGGSRTKGNTFMALSVIAKEPAFELEPHIRTDFVNKGIKNEY